MRLNHLYLRTSASTALAFAVLSGCSGTYTQGVYNRADPLYERRVTISDGQYVSRPDNVANTVAAAPVSTFSIDVDTASYANVRRFINGGKLPPPVAVRTEELVNYFDYRYATPTDDRTPFRVTTEAGPTPWNTGSYLLQIGIKGYAAPSHESPARNLVFLLDVSGSMDAPNKLDLLKKSLRLLVDQLTSRDRVAIVVYAGDSRVVLPATSGHQHREILAAIDGLNAGGATNGGEGIQRAYAIAQDNYIENGINRVILATDGDFNVGVRNVSEMRQLIKDKRRTGVAITILGFGMGNYNDAMLEEISKSGDGNAAYIDSLQEARKVLVSELNATLQIIAYDTKVQVEFNPNVVETYRLIGYENRLLRRQDFKNDHVDAGDVGAGHAVTALYEITLHEKMRYQAVERDTGEYGSELAFVKIRYKRPNEIQSEELAQPVLVDALKTSLKGTTSDFRFAAAVAAFGQRLRNSTEVGDFDFRDILALAQQGRGEDENGDRGEFVKLVGLAGTLRQ